MNNCQICRQRIETLKLHAQQFIHTQHGLLSDNDVLAQMLKQLSTPSQQQRLWKQKYEEMLQVNSKLEQSCKQIRVPMIYNTAYKRNNSAGGGIKRSGSITKMQNFMNRVLNQSKNIQYKLQDRSNKDKKRLVLKL